MSREYIKPQVLALVICDDVIEDSTTRKKSLFGLFDGIGARRFPVIHPSMAVFVTMVGQGNVPLRLELVHAEDITEENGPLLRIEQPEFEFRDPNAVVDFVFKLKGVRFPRPGVYLFRVLAGNHLLCERRFQVSMAESL